jgi:hypothetical protein
MTMTVQISFAKPADPHNGLTDIEGDILAAPHGEMVTAIVTFQRTKRVEDEVKQENYPVIRMTHIEPITSAEALETVKEMQAAAYQVRTGETQLDLPTVDDAADEEDGE